MNRSMPLKLPAKISTNPPRVGIAVHVAFEYWALAQMAEEMGRHDDAASW